MNEGSRARRRGLVWVLLAAAAIVVALAATAWACVPDRPQCREGVSSDDGNWWTDPATDTLRICENGVWEYYAPGSEEPPCNDSLLTYQKVWTDGVRGIESRCELTPDGYRWVRTIDLTPYSQTTADCNANWSVEVLRDPTRSITVRMDFGDGSSDTRTVTQGTGLITVYFYHFFPLETVGQTLTQTATIVERGAGDQSTTYHEYPFTTHSRPEGPATAMTVTVGRVLG